MVHRWVVVGENVRQKAKLDLLGENLDGLSN